jgi:hypothetical protein
VLRRFVLAIGTATAAVGAGVLPRAGAAQAVVNAGFEEPAAAAVRPAGWLVRGAGYELALDSGQAVDGRSSLRSRRTDPAPYDSTAMRFGVAIQSGSPAPALGRTLRLSGWIRTGTRACGCASTARRGACSGSRT